MTLLTTPLKHFSVIVLALLAIAVAITAAIAANEMSPLFSKQTPHASLPSQYRILKLPNVAQNQFALVDDHGTTVLKVDSNDSAGSLGLTFNVDAQATPHLSWRWKINRVLQRADTTKKSGDDYAARVYVFFDVPLASLSFTERTKLRLARMVAGSDLPTAALCYVWDNKTPVGIRHSSPYTTRVHIVTLQSGATHVGEWVEEKHDVAGDFRASFGTAAPRIIGVAVGNDTDQTHESVTTWFGDVSFHAK